MYRFVDPELRIARETFDTMMRRLRGMTADQRLQFGVSRGLLNADGTPKLPEGEPCVSSDSRVCVSCKATGET